MSLINNNNNYYEINKPKTKDDGVQQQAPGWMLTFLRWQNRDTYRYKGKDVDKFRKPMVIQNDCIQLSINLSKSKTGDTLTAILKGADINYLTAISPGDYVTANIKKWGDDILDLVTRARAGKAINRFDDGFKGVFKVNDVRRQISVNSAGIKIIQYTITAMAFTELTEKIHYDPIISKSFEDKGLDFVWLSRISKTWNSEIKGKVSPVGKFLNILLMGFLGGKGELKKTSDGGKTSIKDDMGNRNYYYRIPSILGKLLGVKTSSETPSIYAVNMYRILIGIWGKAKGSDPNEYFSSSTINMPELTGKTVPANVLWNNTPINNIIDQYSNLTINENYTAFRVNSDGHVMPTIIVRQKTLNNLDFTSNIVKSNNITRHLDQPGWDLNMNQIYSLDVGRSDNHRFNFVQVLGVTVMEKGQNASINYQYNQRSWEYDHDDVSRNGLRTYIIQSNNDWPGTEDKNGNKQVSLAKGWSELLGDMIIGGHLKLQGTVQCIGIDEPVAVGDTMLIDGVVYHIETINHTAKIQSNGTKQFISTVTLSAGIDIRSSSSQLYYPEMDKTSYLGQKGEDEGYSDYIPGHTDMENIDNRTMGEDVKEPYDNSFTLDGEKKKRK